jgi:DNA-binding MarR family transcriptional regulator
MFDADDQPIAVMLHDVANRLKVLIDNKVQPYKLTRIKWLTLSILEKNNGISQSELASQLGVDGSAIARLVRRMEDRNLIYRQGDEIDRRIVRVYIKDEARPVLQDLKSISDDVGKEALKGLTSKEQEEFLNALLLIKKNLL